MWDIYEDWSKKDDVIFHELLCKRIGKQAYNSVLKVGKNTEDYLDYMKQKWFI